MDAARIHLGLVDDQFGLYPAGRATWAARPPRSGDRP